MILKAKHNIIIYNFFRNYAIRKTNKVFDKVFFDGNFEDKNKPILLIANHVSWWDGFWLMYLNRKMLHRKFHFMMLENQLKKFWFFNYTGGFSINKQSKSIIETLNYTLDLLKDSNNLIIIFPQGKITSKYESNIKFEKGLDWIIKRAMEIQILQVVNLVDYFSNPKPSLYVYFKEYKISENNKNIDQSFQQFYNQSIEKQKLKAF